jgi:hypothetical protein
MIGAYGSNAIVQEAGINAMHTASSLPLKVVLLGKSKLYAVKSCNVRVKSYNGLQNVANDRPEYIKVLNSGWNCNHSCGVIGVSSAAA